MEEFLAGESNYYNINYCYSELRNYLEELGYKNHLFIQSSGTGNVKKTYALSLESLLTSARDVNELLKITSSDRWMCPLSNYHIGGFSIGVRAHLSGTPVDRYLGKWSPTAFYQQLTECKSTLLSLVPTQLYDLVSLELKAPTELRVVLVGGDALPSRLAEKAIALGWPIYSTYGMTEFCSQIATSKYSREGIELLSGFEIKIIDQTVAIKSNKMFTSITTEIDSRYSTAAASEFCQDGHYLTQDRGEVKDGRIKILGRVDKLIKLKGHFIDLSEVEGELHNQMVVLGAYSCAVLKTEEDPRVGIKPIICSLKSTEKHAQKAAHSIKEKFPILKGIIEVELVESIDQLKQKRPYL